MTNRFLISVAAAALIAGTGLANAQGAGGMSREGGAGATVQQGAPPAAAGAAQPAPQHRESAPPSSGAKSSQSEKALPGAARQAEDMKGGKAGKDMKAEGRDGREKSTVGQAPDKSGATTPGREDRMGRDKTAPTSAQGREDKSGTMDRDRTNAETRSGPQTTTTGQAGAGAKLSTEQRTQITSVIRSQRVAPVTNVNFSVSVGTRVPRTVEFHTLPAEVVTIYPQWRGYRFIIVKEEIVIIDPNTYEIVAVIVA